MNWKTIFNPFVKFDEKKLLLAGIGSAIIVFSISYLLGYQMDSLFHFNYLDKKDSLLKSIGYTLLVYAISSLVFYIYGKIINKKTRFIDIITPVLISQCVGIFVVLLSEIPLVKNAQQEILSSTENIAPHFSPLTLITILVFSILSLTISVYGIALLYNGFKTATNMKNWYHIVVFAILLLTLMISMQFLQ
ncbi:YIP1 family protein [Chryseobacterium sp.]|uniref:YIP1 family protein n=1 Tax=Chryseobacterium sp. TaxID=1871047 RepID=UPI0028A1B402|nr:YIP1 family protein [Chryseobacterium sp.]